MPYTFPPVAGLERAKSDPAEPLYNGSIGSNRIFHTLSITAGLNTSPRWDLYLINVYTLLRNAYTSGISQLAIEKIVDTDVDLFMVFISAYMTYQRQLPGAVLFYAPDYRAISEILLRKTSGQRDEMDKLYTELLKKLPRKLTELTEDPLLRKFLVATSGNTFPHKELPNHMRSILYSASRATAPRIGTVLLSHCPIDLHLATLVPGLELIDSFTSAVYPVSEFGRKLTKDVKVPFNTTTHRVFGDDVHLAAMCKGKDKTQLIELANTRKWAIRTEREIISDITTTFPNITESMLSQLRL